MPTQSAMSILRESAIDKNIFFDIIIDARIKIRAKRPICRRSFSLQKKECPYLPLDTLAAI